MTDAQTEKLYALKSEFKAEVRPKVMDLLTAENKMRDLLTEPNVDNAQVVSLQGQINSARDALGNLKVQNKLQQMSILTDAQRQELHREFLRHSIGLRRS
jgi:Spy/CpxP family protein refolding chaperone